MRHAEKCAITWATKSGSEIAFFRPPYKALAPRKLAPKFAGPYTIAAQLGPNVYEVVDQDEKSGGKVHVEDLKPFHEKGRLARKIRKASKPKRVPQKSARSARPLP